MSRILLVEDDRDQAEVLGFSLRKDRHAVHMAYTGNEGLRTVATFRPEIIILDVLLPDLTGFELLPFLRKETAVPILLLSAARCSEDDRAAGLALGAQDYLAKSHSHRELLVRVRNLLDLQANTNIIHLAIGARQLTIFADRQKVEWDGEQVRLTATEFKILLQLVRGKGATISYCELGEAIWEDPLTDASTIKSHVSRLRAKFMDKEGGSDLIRNRHALGYALNICRAEESRANDAKGKFLQQSSR